MFESFEYQGKMYLPLAICCATRAEATIEMYEKKGHKNLTWIPLDNKGIDGKICEIVG